jgi:ubiquinone/menaquinone biosynthesis C-methylase UbiE
MMNKQENPKRVEELSPPETLGRIGLKEDGAFCDIGAGTGIFTFAAAKRTKSDVYAVEIDDAMLQILQAKKLEKKAGNVRVKKNIREVPSNACDVALLCTVLHELEDPEGMMSEIKRILLPGGTLAVIEFHKRRTPLGPPEARRISPDRTRKSCAACLRKTEYSSWRKFLYAACRGRLEGRAESARRDRHIDKI